MLQVLKTDVKQVIKGDQELQLKIAKLFQKKNIVTIQRWVRDDNPILTLPGVLDVISEHAGYSKGASLTENPKGVKKVATA